ncbi:MAG TPA: ATPase, T2SS/T4P/T4SS family, partial [Opitutaceae bacterium]|nr:ATPase, T2SS/T4P/T4SS family [Opitutaceae bacterium]
MATPESTPSARALRRYLRTDPDVILVGKIRDTQTAELKRRAMRGGMKMLHHDPMLKVKLGITTIEEAPQRPARPDRLKPGRVSAGIIGPLSRRKAAGRRRCGYVSGTAGAGAGLPDSAAAGR